MKPLEERISRFKSAILPISILGLSACGPAIPATEPQSEITSNSQNTKENKYSDSSKISIRIQEENQEVLFPNWANSAEVRFNRSVEASKKKIYLELPNTWNNEPIIFSSFELQNRESVNTITPSTLPVPQLLRSPNSRSGWRIPLHELYPILRSIYPKLELQTFMTLKLQIQPLNQNPISILVHLKLT